MSDESSPPPPATESKGPPQWLPPPTEQPDSSALIASNNGKGVILDHDNGPSITYLINNAGYEIQEVGFGDEAPDGLSIWEGCVYREPDWEEEILGSFRDLTPEEAVRYVTEGQLWELPPKKEEEESVLWLNRENSDPE